VLYAILFIIFTILIIAPKGGRVDFLQPTTWEHILVKHPVTWRKWKSVNVAFDIKELH
jgi:hypothetical protein